MKQTIRLRESELKRIIAESVKNIISEEEFKQGASIVIPGGEAMGRKIIRAKYGLNPDDFEYVGGGKFIKTKNSGKVKRTVQPKKEKEFLGRKENETEQDYLERVRELNKKFADTEKEIEGEQWRPVVNTGRYRSGNTDYTRTHEVSNMGRLRTLDYEDPMRSRISTGYDAPSRKARQFHLDARTADGEWEKTTPPVHTMVADAWLDAPEGNIEDYYVAHIDGNYHNNRADNLEYRPRQKGRAETPLAESVRRMINKSVRRVLNEVRGWALEKGDVTWVNGEEDGNKPWIVRLWTGSGYYLPSFGAFADSEEDALEKVVAYLDQKGNDSFFCDDYVEQIKEELAQEGKDDEDIWREIDEQFYYVDSTMDGGGCHYVFLENLAVYPYEEKKFR